MDWIGLLRDPDVLEYIIDNAWPNQIVDPKMMHIETL